MPDSSANSALSLASRRPSRLRAGSLLPRLDLAFIAIAWVPFLALGAPAVGYAAGAGAWILQRALASADKRFIARARSATAQLGFSLAEAFGRIWLLAGAIAAAGLAGGRPDGLAAALVILCAYTVAFAVRLVSGRAAAAARASAAPPAAVAPPVRRSPR
jgi:hypothetical protein